MATCIHSSRSCLPPFYTIPIFPLLNRKIFHLLVKYELRQVPSNGLPNFRTKPYPSNDLFCHCFLQDFIENKLVKWHLNLLMDISIDYTFKVAANLGYVRPDGRWISQYGSLLIVLDNCGKGIAWQFTSSTSIDEVKPMLSLLKKRLMSQTSNLQTIYVDNCCIVRAKLQSIFGTQVRVCLDIFHASQRLLRRMSKRDPLFTLCRNNVSMIFRDLNDRGVERKQDTPSPQALLENVRVFIQKWEKAEIDGWHILNDKVISDFAHPRVHITCGCLSHIPPGGGTNRNENLHRTLNPFFSRCRMGIPLALALLTALFHRHNQKLSNTDTCYSILSARTQVVSKPCQCESFGVVEKKGGPDNEHWIFGVKTNSTDTTLSQLHSQAGVENYRSL